MKVPISAALVEQVRLVQQGCAEAAEEVSAGLTPPLLAFITPLVRQPLARLFDPKDFVNATLTSFCLGHFPPRALSSPEELWAYTRTVACHLVYRERRKYVVCARRRLTKDVPLADVEEEAMARQDPPEEPAMVHEFLEQFPEILKRLAPWKRGIAELGLRSYSPAEIADALGVKESRVYPVLAWLKEQMRQQL